MPAVVVTGARQTGKSTLAEHLVAGKRRYATLDDLDVLDAARRDPEILVGGTSPVTLDEVQREPGLLRAVKRAIDRDRSPGRFLLTGSANLLLMRQVSESLAGRASYLTLWPMTRREQRGLGRCGLWDELLATPDAGWHDLLAAGVDRAEDWRVLARHGGFPTPALALAGGRRTPDLVRRLCANLPRTRSAGSCVDQRAAGLQAPHARDLPAPRTARQPDRAGPRRGASPAYGAPLAQSVGDLVPPGAAAGLCRQPYQASYQGAQGLLGRYWRSAAPGRSRRAGRRALRESHLAGLACLARRAPRDTPNSAIGERRSERKWTS